MEEVHLFLQAEAVVAAHFRLEEVGVVDYSHPLLALVLLPTLKVLLAVTPMALAL
jgi:hypothetical protein